ncbi:MAG: hypothetical protein ACHQF4_11825 [Sphingobacteriales bacterium]
MFNRLKYSLIALYVFTALGSSAQKITGTITDKTTGEPVRGAMVSLGNSNFFTNTLGAFELDVSSYKDTLKIVHFAYVSYIEPISPVLVVLHIQLEPAVIKLKEVRIHSARERSFKEDSINNRLEYASQFNYKGLTVMDAFSGNPNKQPDELISVNPLLLIAALTKKGTPEYKFNKILLRDEQAAYVDRKFNRGIVSQITGMKGDTLSGFLTRYRPTYQFVKKASDYEMINYIKDSYKQFKTEGFKGSSPFANQN